MPHFELDNSTPFVSESLLLADEEGVPQFVLLVQATFSIQSTGELPLLEEQAPIVMEGAWYGDPATSSLRWEPQMAFIKPATDVILLGHAHSPALGVTEMQVGIRIGPVSKIARVVGDRFLIKRQGATAMSAPRPFETIPLRYERAFGGWDRRAADPSEHRCEQRNPVGVGFRAVPSDTDDEVRLPNIEYETQPFRTYGDTPAPAGFGFLGANWMPRLAYAGTYDEQWDTQRKPLLPWDFDRRFFNAASVGLVAPGYLTGDEPAVVIGASPEGRITFNLPGIPPPECLVALRGRNRISLDAQLDTVVVDMDDRRLTLLWRSHVAVRNGPHDVLSVGVSADLRRL
jgi:hypothetical protein